jgi:hypothetical protein
MNATSEVRTKIVKIGSKPFEIPSNMTASSMAECWEGGSQALETSAQAIVDYAEGFAHEIVHRWLHKHHCVLQPTDDPEYQAREKRAIEWATRTYEQERKKARRMKNTKQ